MTTAFAKKILTGFSFLLLLASCDPNRKINKDIVYFQQDRGNVPKPIMRELLIKNGDQLKIQIYTKSLLQEQAALFNITADQGYIVTNDGFIDLPVVGGIKAAGLTRYQLQDIIRDKVANYVKDPVVGVRFQQININVLGEVRGPGTKTFTRDRITIIDAISAAGDLTDYGRRENVTVSREENNGARKLYEIDLRSTSLFASPVYQLQQNDIVYVNPNHQRLRMLKEKSTILQDIQVGASFFSIITSVYLLIRK